MNAETLRANLAPNIAPEAVSWWPPGTGWWVLAVLLLVGLIVGLAWYSWHTPWWRWWSVKRLQQGYLMELDQLRRTAQAEVKTSPTPGAASAFNRALSQWLRRLMRDGLGVPPNLPPAAFYQACVKQSTVPMPAFITRLLHQVYSPEPAYELVIAHHDDLSQLCRTCLNLHSPGPG